VSNAGLLGKGFTLTSSSSQQKQSLVSFTILWDDQRNGRWYIV